MSKEKDELFEAPKGESVVGYIDDPEEQKKLLEEAKRAKERSLALLKESKDVKESGEVAIKVVTPTANLDPKGELKEYLLLLDGVYKEDESTFRDWEVVTGRESAYSIIKQYMESDEIEIDLVSSLILVSVEKFEEAKTCYDFMEWIITNDIIGGDELYPHLEEYVKGDVDE